MQNRYCSRKIRAIGFDDKDTVSQQLSFIWLVLRCAVGHQAHKTRGMRQELFESATCITLVNI